MPDVNSMSESAKATAAGVSVCLPVLTALAGIGGALGSQWLSHHFAAGREQRASEEKLQRERYFIATELVFLLEQYAEGCARVAADEGEYISASPGALPEREPVVSDPTFTYENISGDWRVLTALLMYRIRELPVLQHEARRMIAYAGENDSPPDYSEYFHERQYQYARLGLKAVIQAIRLRRLAGLPETRLAATQWSAQPVLWEVWRRERHRRAVEAVENRKLHEQNDEKRMTL